jgi:hypothetical protein
MDGFVNCDGLPSGIFSFFCFQRESDFAAVPHSDANNYAFTVLACSIRLLCFSFFFVYIHDDSESTAFLDQLPTALFCKTSFCIIHAMVKVDKR